MFKIKDVFDFLEDFGDYSKSEKVSLMTKLLGNKEFKKWLFCPDDNDKTVIQNASKLYEYFTKLKVMKCIIAVIEERDLKCSRTTAVLTNSIANVAIEAGSERINELVDARKSGRIGDGEYKRYRADAEDYLEVANLLKKISKQIIKPQGKKLAKVTGLPKRLCYESLMTTPDPQFITKYKIGVYLNNLLHNIYEIIDEESSSIFYIFKNSGSKFIWDDFFKYVFGEKNLIEIATFCLLEGFQRIKNYKSRAVSEAWESLTEWALTQLENANDGERDQMLELYIKRISKMFANTSEKFDLRVDLLELPSRFGRLRKSVDKYSDKIRAITHPDEKGKK